MLNRIVLVGRLVKDPNLRYTPNGVAVANFTIAVNRPFSNQQGERKADFINCVVWRRPAENLANFMSKGNLIGVDGRIQTRNYDGDDGKRVFITEIVAESVQFLESKSGSSNQSGNQSNQNNQSQSNQENKPNDQKNNNDNSFDGNAEPIDISDDDLPF